jgi:hypothetical protein
MNCLLRIVVRLARTLGAGAAAALIFAALPACDSGTTSSPALAPSPFRGLKFYLPLAVGNTWTYTCGGGVTLTDSISAAQPVGSIEAFRFVLQFPGGSSQTQLLANNADGTTTLYGHIFNGNPVFVVPEAIIVVDPAPGQSFNYRGPLGNEVSRNFVSFRMTHVTPLGIFNAAVYTENGGTDTYSYALGTGIAEQTHGTSDCLLASVHLH